MPRHLHDGHKGVYILILLQIGHLLGGNDDIQNLDDLRGLYADAGETDPALVAGAVVLTEDDQCDQQRDIYHAQPLPLLTENIRVQHRQHDESDQPQKQRERLNYYELARTHGRRRARDEDKPVRRADNAHHEQKYIRPLEKLPHGILKLFYFKAPPFVEQKNTIRLANAQGFILSLKIYTRKR